MSYAFSSSGRKVIPKVSFSMKREIQFSGGRLNCFQSDFELVFIQIHGDELHFDSRLNA